MLEQKSWKPSLTSQFDICPIPFHLDTYRGCAYNCTYCFARDFITFSRRNSEHKESTYLVANDYESFTRWLNRIDRDSKYYYEKGNEIAIKERIPLKIGATADPCPPLEAQAKVTYKFLKILDYFDYPVEIQTKNPNILASYAKEFNKPNWTIAVTIITLDADFAKVTEPNAPSPSKRLDGIKALVEQGKKVMVKIQPAIYPKIIQDLPQLVEGISKSGCWAFNTEGLKIRVTMPQHERVLFNLIGSSLGIDIFNYYKEHGQVTGSDRELKTDLKLEYVALAKELANAYNLKYFPSDNDTLGLGDGCECCGTQVLRDYKIWGNNLRSKAFEPLPYESQELGKCLVNFTRSTKNVDKTLNEVIEEKEGRLKEEPSTSLIHTAYPGKIREYKEVSPTISTPSGGGHLPKVAQALQRDGQLREGVSWGTDKPQSRRNIRRLTPTECARLQGFPDSINVMVMQ